MRIIVSRGVIALAACLVGTVAVVLALAPGSSAAHTARVAPPGPKLTVPAATLASALTCPKRLHHLKKDPVLLLPATGATGAETWSWNYAITLPKAGYAVCIVTLPDFALGDIPTASQYVVAAIRRMFTESGRKISVIGLSQGGLEGRWALRFWPDLRADVDHYIGIVTPQHGTTLATPLCAMGCAPGLFQQTVGSKFLTALNAGEEIFPGPSWTALYTQNDDVVQPQTGPDPSSALHPRAGVASSSIAVQSVCPNADNNPAWHSHHIGSLGDPVFFALVMDALSHPGPAEASRIPPSVCSETSVPGLDPATVTAQINSVYAQLFTRVETAPKVAAEPALPAYAP